VLSINEYTPFEKYNFKQYLNEHKNMYWLKQGDTSGTAGFESLAAECVTDGSLCYFGPSSLQVIH